MNINKYKWIGLDIDHTLIRYNEISLFNVFFIILFISKDDFQRIYKNISRTKRLSI